VEEAAFRSIPTAASLINLDEHRGEHPRIGATDVVPFVPISGASMQDCVEIARRGSERDLIRLEVEDGFLVHVHGTQVPPKCGDV